jgi:hypothetical protein
MRIFAIIPLPRNPDGLVYHIFPVSEKVNAVALAKSPVTGEYFLATDIARLVSNEKDEGYSTGKSSIDRYITEIRKIIAEFDFTPTMIREPNGGYHAKLPVNKADRPGFPLELPEKEGGHA